MRTGSKKKTAKKLQKFEEICRSRGLALTMQRRLVLEAMLARVDHPTADRVFEELKTGHPEISRATVYRTLDKLVELGILRKVCHPGSAVRYDPNMERHHHLVCLKCSRMVDYCDPKLNEISMPAAGTRGFRINDYSIQFRGICMNCRRRQKKRKNQGEPC